ncbi:MAG: Smr/MutS family protein [bacterium]
MTVKKGDSVWVERVKENGIVQSLSRDGLRAVVGMGKVNLDVPVDGLGAPRKVRRTEERGRISASRPSRRGGPARELDMHGLRVEEAIPLMDRFLNEALLDGLPEVRIIHGHGTGAIRKAVHQRLKALGIRRFRLGELGQTPGGDGVTIVSL